MVWGKRNVYKLDVNKSRECFCGRGRGRPSCVEGSKTDKAYLKRAHPVVQGSEQYKRLNILEFYLGKSKNLTAVYISTQLDNVRNKHE